MPGCCEPGDFDKIFSPTQARRDAKRFVRSGLGAQSRWIFDALAPQASGRTVLEVGGGVGGLQIELLRAGAAHATNIELSPGYEGVARELLEANGVADRAERSIGDFVAEEQRVPAADLVILDRVVCCYPDATALVGAAARHADRALALTFPVERWWMRAARVLINVWPHLRGSRFRFFVHPTALVVATAEAAGLRVSARRHGWIWQLLVFTR